MLPFNCQLYQGIKSNDQTSNTSKLFEIKRDGVIRAFTVTMSILFIFFWGSYQILSAQGKTNGTLSAFPNQQLPPEPQLSIDQKSLDLGVLPHPGLRKGHLLIRNNDPKPVSYEIIMPAGWTAKGSHYKSDIPEQGSEYVYLTLSAVRDKFRAAVTKNRNLFRLNLKIEGINRAVLYEKEFSVGPHNESLVIRSAGGSFTVELLFTIDQFGPEPRIDLAPERLDLGILPAKEKPSLSVQVRNTGSGLLRWAAKAASREEIAGSGSFSERFISFSNREAAGSGQPYVPPGHLRETLELSGKWVEEGGFPVSAQPMSAVKFNFNGTGISIVNIRNYDEGPLAFFINDEPVDLASALMEKPGETELLIGSGLPPGQHTLTVIKRDGRITFEGVKIQGRQLSLISPGLINIFPKIGTTTKETDYVRITLDTHKLLPGNYLAVILFSTDHKKESLEVYFDIEAPAEQKIIAIYRYARGAEYLLTPEDMGGAKKPLPKEFEKQGIVFYLFPPNTLATTEFFRWHNPQRKDYFYSYHPGGGKELKGYIQEGPVGNIATSRIANTRPLYRWYNKKTGKHFFTTDPKGEDAPKAGYIFEGIAGFVR